MEINVAIGGGQKMTLTGAILVYQGGHEAFAAWHAARAAEDGAGPYLGEAEPLTTEFLRALSEGLGAYVVPEILPSSVLVRTSELLVWWTRAQAHLSMSRQAGCSRSSLIARSCERCGDEEHAGRAVAPQPEPLFRGSCSSSG